MSALLFVLIFLVLGLGVLFVAMSGGPGGALGTIMSQSRSSRRFAVVAFFLAVVILGVGVPAAVIAAISAHDAVPEANVTELTSSEEHGRDLFGQRCAACHTLRAANAVAQVGPNLDDLRPPKSLVLDAIKRGRAQGNGQMPAQVFEGKDAQDVAAFVAKAVGQTGQPAQ
jgi:mono/diheme cytochrome c family protein